MRALRRVERLLLWPLKPPLSRSGYVRMNPDGRLRDYPFVVVRFACRERPRMAGTASPFSPSALARTRIGDRSGGYFGELPSPAGKPPRAWMPCEDLPPTQPPDLPADLRMPDTPTPRTCSASLFVDRG